MQKLLKEWTLLGRLVCFVALSHVALSQAQSAYPSRPVRVVVPFPAGTAPDIGARQWSERMSKLLQQPFIVDNKAGAATIVGVQAVAAAPADGYTLLYTANGTITINPSVYKRLPYKPSDLVAVTKMLLNPVVISVSAQSPYNTVKELVAAAKARPGEISFASYGVGTAPHMSMAYFLSKAEITMNHVPYRDGGLTDVISGRVDTAFSPLGDVLQYVRAGRVKALAVSSPHRIDTLPQVPAVAELYPGFESDPWQGVFALKGTPQAIVELLARMSRRVAESEEYKKSIGQLGLIASGESLGEFEQAIRTESKRWAAVVETNNITLEQ